MKKVTLLSHNIKSNIHVANIRLGRSAYCAMGNKGEQTKRLICSAAYELFAQKGFREVTMKDICERTMLSRGGL